VVASGDPSGRPLVAALTVIWGVRPAAHMAWRSRDAGEPGRVRAAQIYLTQGAVLVSPPVQVAQRRRGCSGR